VSNRIHVQSKITLYIYKKKKTLEATKENILFASQQENIQLLNSLLIVLSLNFLRSAIV